MNKMIFSFIFSKTKLFSFVTRFLLFFIGECENLNLNFMLSTILDETCESNLDPSAAFAFYIIEYIIDTRILSISEMANCIIFEKQSLVFFIILEEKNKVFEKKAKINNNIFFLYKKAR